MLYFNYLTSHTKGLSKSYLCVIRLYVHHYMLLNRYLMSTEISIKRGKYSDTVYLLYKPEVHMSLYFSPEFLKIFAVFLILRFWSFGTS